MGGGGALFREPSRLGGRYHSLPSARNFVSESSAPGTVTTAWVTSGEPFRPDFLLSKRILPGNLNSPSLSLASGQKGIVHADWHATASDSCVTGDGTDVVNLC